MKIKTATLLDILNHFKFIFIDNNYIKDSKYIFFNIEKNTIWCYSDVLVYTFKPEYSIEETFGITTDIALPAKELFMLIKKIKAEEISIQQRGDKYIIRNGRSTNTLAIPTFTPDVNKWQDQNRKPDNNLPENTSSLFKTFMKFEKEDDCASNIVFEDGFMVSSDLYSFIKAMTDFECTGFAVKQDILKHILQFDLDRFCADDIMVFSDGMFSLYCKNTINNVFEYKQFFEPMEEEVDLSYSITLEKGEDIDFIDSFLLNYKKKDKKIVVAVHENRLVIVATGDKGTQESRASIAISKHNAGDSEKFKINSDYFKDIYSDYDWFNILDGKLYCYNVENGVERLVVIKNL